jgi:hypothetical protein
MSKEYKTFNEFYPYYLSQHCNTYCKTLHFIGTSLVIALTISSIVIAGYIFAWVGHYFFEKNKPATFKYPLFSLLSDFKMYYELLTLKIPFDSSIEK